MALATLSIDLIAKIAGLQEGLDKAGRMHEKHAAQVEARYARIKAAAASIGGVLGGAFTVAGVTAWVQASNQALLAIKDLSEATGASIPNVSALEDVARKAGGTIDDVSGILVKFNQVLGAADGKNEVSQALKAIGLDAEKLRQIDPAEALRQTAVALAGFADDGNKARLTQELFGKSIREAAPYLKELAEVGELNGKVTKEQTEQADKFAKSLAQLKINAEDSGRAFAAQLIPAVNQFVDVLRGGVGGGDSPITRFLTVPLQTVAVLGANVAFVFRGLGREIGGIAAQAGALASGNFAGVKAIREALIADGVAARAELESIEARFFRIGQVIPQASYSNEGRPRSLPLLPDLGGKKDDQKPKATKPTRYPGQAIQEAFAGELEKSLLKLERISPDNLISMEEALRGFNNEQERLNALLQATPTADIERQRKDIALLIEARDQNLISLDKFTEAVQTRIGTLPEVIKPATDAMTEFTLQFQRNVQDIMGDTVLSTLKGDFGSITKLWGNMLLSMASQAIAADLGSKLFPKEGPGILSMIGKLFGFAKGGVFSGGAQVTAFASGGIVGSPSYFPMRGGLGLMGEAGPEAIMPLRRGRDGKLGVAGGGSVTNVYNVSSGVTRNELMTALQLMQKQIEGNVYGNLRTRGVI